MNTKWNVCEEPFDLPWPYRWGLSTTCLGRKAREGSQSPGQHAIRNRPSFQIHRAGAYIFLTMGCSLWFLRCRLFCFSIRGLLRLCWFSDSLGGFSRLVGKSARTPARSLAQHPTYRIRSFVRFLFLGRLDRLRGPRPRGRGGHGGLIATHWSSHI